MKKHLAVLLSLLALCCAPTLALGELVAPPRLDDGWDTASPASVQLDEAPLRALSERLRDGTYKNIHSVLLVKDGRLVAEEYFTGCNAEGKEQTFDRDTLHSLQSVSKSVNSILIGIAIDQHLIAGVQEKVAKFFPERAELFADGGKDALQLKHLLSMSAGLAWTESGFPYTDARNDAFGLNRSNDPLGYVFAKPVAAPPGREFNYHSGLSIVLGQVVRGASGLDPDKFAERHLFGPLGIANYRWGRLPDGSVHTGGGLWLRPRDMAKLGQLFLDGGRWQGKQIVSEEWVRASTRQQAPYRGYGYQW